MTYNICDTMIDSALQNPDNINKMPKIQNKDFLKKHNGRHLSDECLMSSWNSIMKVDLLLCTQFVLFLHATNAH